MSLSKFNLEKRAVTVSYVRAYMEAINWETVFDPEVLSLLKEFSVKLNSRLESCIGSLITTTSALMGPHTRISLSEGYSIPTNIFLLNVSDLGCGKSPAFDNIIRLSMEKLKEQKMKDFTVQVNDSHINIQIVLKACKNISLHE